MYPPPALSSAYSRRGFLRIEYGFFGGNMPLNYALSSCMHCPNTRVCCTNSRAFHTRKTLNYCTVQMSIVVLYIAAHFWQFTRHRNPTKHYKNVNSHLVKADFPQRPMQTMRLRTSHITFLMQCTKALQHIHSVSINILPFMPTVRNNTPMFFLIQCIIEKNRGLGGTDLLEKSAPMTF